MNKLLLYSFFLSFLAQATEITTKDNEYLKIYDYDVNHVLHILNHDTTKNFEKYEQIRLPQSSNNAHTLKSQVNLKGSAFKATDVGFWVSKLAVHAAAQIAYALIAGATALVYPPAAPVVYCSLQFTFAALVEIASNMVAYGITIALGARVLV